MNWLILHINNYGNLCQRIFSFVKNNCDGEVKITQNYTKDDKKLLNFFKNTLDKLREMIDQQDLNNYLKSVIELSFVTNKYINDTEPWKLKKKDPERMNTVLSISLDQIAKITILLNPIIPKASDKVLKAMNISDKFKNLSFIKENKIFNNNIKINDLDILFKKFE